MVKVNDIHSREAGMTTAGFAVMVPVLMLFTLLPIQFGFWWNARQVVLLAASEAADVAATETGSSARANDVATDVLQSSGWTENEQIAVSGVGGTEVTVSITADMSWGILPILRTVNGQAEAPTERFINPAGR